MSDPTLLSSAASAFTNPGNPSQNAADAVTAVSSFVSGAGSTAFTGATSALTNAATINDVRNTTAQENITFPSDLLSGDQKYYMQFRFQKYQKRSLAEQATRITVTTQEGIGALQLPIPNQLADTHSAQYSQGNMSVNIGGAAGRALSGAVLEQGMRSFENTSQNSNVLDKVMQAYRNINTNDVASGAGSISMSSLLAAGLNAPLNTGNIASALTGLTTNPFMSLLYQNPIFKTHQFSWRFIPRTPEESENVRKIVRTFQYHMLPTMSQSYILFGYPSMAIITLAPTDTYLYKFKPCVITSFTANYAPTGPSFYKGGKAAPAAVEISVNLHEIEYWTAETLATATGIQQAATQAVAPASPAFTSSSPLPPNFSGG